MLHRHFLDARGRVVEGYDEAFTTAEDYRGRQRTMHMVEAALVLGDVLGEGDARLAPPALGMAEHLVHDVARRHDHLLPEHFTPTWEPVLDYNTDRRDDPFRPYGCTPGHLLEWSRLLRCSSRPRCPIRRRGCSRTPGPCSTPPCAGLGRRRRRGFVYTVDWTGTPVVRQRMHWVLAEAIAAAAALARRTGDPAYARWEADVVGVRRAAPRRPRARQLAPRARPAQPAVVHGVAGRQLLLLRGCRSRGVRFRRDSS